MPSFALIADPHLPEDPGRVLHGSQPSVHFDEVVTQIVRQSVDRVFILGDCAADEGLPGDYAALVEKLAPVLERNIPVHAIPGNHDRPDHLADALAAAWIRPDWSGLPARVEMTEADWLLLDTSLPEGEVAGEVAENDFCWLDQNLRPGHPSILLGHHHPESPDRPEVDPGIGLRNSSRFIEWLDQCPTASASVFGHTHRWHVGRSPSGVCLVNLPAAGFAFDPHEPVGWVLGELDTDSLHLLIQTVTGSPRPRRSRFRIPLRRG